MKNKKVYNQWKKYFVEHGLNDDIIDSYLSYIAPLLEKDLPIIFEINHLCLLLGRKKTYLTSVINSQSYHYREFKIPKKRGGHRVISSPYPALLECQRWINEYILSKVKNHHSCHGFAKKRSIISNASQHLNKRQLLKVDIKNYFSSIEINKVISVFKNLSYSQNVSFYLARLCTLNNVLPQGAATSPSLSNIISFYMDKRLHNLSKKYNISYTRYADDMTFSGNYIPVKFISIINEIINECGFILNHDKTRLSTKSGKRIVTGISVAGHELKIPRNYKRKLRQEIHYIKEYGYYSHLSKKKIRDPFYLNKILGKLNYWNQVEPNNSFVLEAIEYFNNILRNK
jgi:RNA-directed DNA polymerase